MLNIVYLSLEEQKLLMVCIYIIVWGKNSEARPRGRVGKGAELEKPENEIQRLAFFLMIIPLLSPPHKLFYTA